jgi:hypothetical protein
MNHVVHVSSNANNGTNAGTFQVNANNDSSNANRNIGTHLAVSCAFKLTPSPWGEYADPIQLGRETEQLGDQQLKGAL